MNRTQKDAPVKITFGVDPSLVKEFLWLIRQDTTIIKPRIVPDVTIHDKDDLGILAAAITAEADVLVTGDKELQDLKRVERTTILSPRAFWTLLTAEQDKSGARDKRAADLRRVSCPGAS